MDDPMRGVDVGTKQEVYAIIRAEADGGPHLRLVLDRDGRDGASATASMSSAKARIVAELTRRARSPNRRSLRPRFAGEAA